jgi:translation initiation factor 5
MLNITGSRVVEDVNFRYKMPRMIAKTEGRGNGIKTVIGASKYSSRFCEIAARDCIEYISNILFLSIPFFSVNMSDIATALNRPPDLVTKFFGVDLGAQSKYDEEADKCTVNGAHTTPDLQKLLNVFIDKFVLCPNCHLPESALAIRKGMIFHKCSACGGKEPVDLSHKLCVFILRMAEVELAKVRDAEAADKKARKEKKAAKAAAEAAAGGGGAAGVEKKEKKAKKESKRAKAEKEAAAAAARSNAAAGGEDDDDDEEGGAEDDDDDDDDDLTPAAAVAAKRAAVEAAASANSAASALQSALEALLASPKVESLATAVLAASKGHSQATILSRFSQAALSGGDALPLLKAVPLALKALYDVDVIEEEAVKTWHASEGVDTRVKDKAKPFVVWLATADEDDDEDEEDE